MYKLNCIECGFIWASDSADVYQCPVCESDDIVVLKKENDEENDTSVLS